jgi:hypothetical protein
MSSAIAEVGLVHGSGFENIEGTYFMSSGSRANADKSLELLQDGTIEKVVCSGRGPIQDDRQKYSEASLMADHLIRAGVPVRFIEVEDTSTSAVGNWANSAPIIQHQLNADSVIGISAKPNIKRMHIIGSFVAARSDFELVGYSASDMRPRPKDYPREIISVYGITLPFLSANGDTPISDLSEAYEEYKSRLGLAYLKRYIHRNAATSRPTV